MHIYMLLLFLLAAAGFVFGMAYTSSGAQSGLGTLLQVNVSGNSPPNWITVGEIVDLSMSSKNLFDDSTNMQSLAKEFLSVLPDPGKLTCTMNRVSNDAGQQILEAKFQTRQRMQYQITVPINTAAGQMSTGDVYGFLAYVESYQPDFKADKKIVTKLDLQITNAVSFVAGS